MQKRKHLLAAAGAYTIWGSFPLFLRQLQGFEASHVLYFRILFAALLALLIGLLFYRKEWQASIQLCRELGKRHRQQALLLLAAGGLLLSINWLLYIYVVNTVNIQTASFAYMLCPVLTALLGGLLLKESLLLPQRLAIGMGLASCLLLGTVSWQNSIYSICIALSYALFLLSQKKIPAFNRLLMLCFQLWLSIGIIAFSFRLAGQSPVQSTFLWTMTLLMALFFTLLPLLLNLYGLSGLSSGTVGFLMYINPLINFLCAFLVFKEQASLTQVLAYILAGSAVVVYNYNYLRKAGKMTA